MVGNSRLTVGKIHNYGVLLTCSASVSFRVQFGHCFSRKLVLFLFNSICSVKNFFVLLIGSVPMRAPPVPFNLNLLFSFL